MKLPEAFEARMKQLLSEEYDSYLACFEKNYAGGIRVNTLKTTPEEFAAVSPFELQRIPWIKKGFYYPEKEQPAKHPYYYAGLYYIQEPSAMTPASLLPVEPGERVLDLCAAPGGKSTELAAKLCGEGVLVANDISNSRAKALLKNLEVFGVKNAVIISETPAKLSDTFEGYFDKILVDAPCSGEGMFRKSPAIMKNWEQYGVNYYNKLQKEILPLAVKMLKPGGMLLYSTCTFSPEEDEGTVAWLLTTMKELSLLPAVPDEIRNLVDGTVMTLPGAVFGKEHTLDGKEEELRNVSFQGFSFGRPEWIDTLPELCGLNEEMKNSIKRCIRFWPHKIGGEGHFLALFQKSDTAEGTKTACQPAVREKNAISSEAIEFFSRLNLEIDFNRVMVREERIYLLPEGIPDLKGLRVLRSGLLLGEQKKGRFEPSQALACALRADQYDFVYHLPSDSDDVIRYLKCETIQLNQPCKDGYVLVCTDGFPLGWGKVNKGSFKNKFLPGWRMM